MSRKQWIGLAGAVLAILGLVLLFQQAPRLFAGVSLPADDPAERMAFAATWLAIPGGALLIGVWAAARRGFMPDAIDGTRTPADYGLEINLRYNQNTVEQVILAAIAWIGLGLALPVQHLYLIPAMAMAFAVGRATFWIGYLIHPMGRAFGMVATMLPTLSAYRWLAWRLFTR